LWKTLWIVGKTLINQAFFDKVFLLACGKLFGRACQAFF